MNLWLPEKLKQRLKIYAVQQNKSASAIAAEAIEEYLLYREPEPTPPAPAKLNGKKEGAAA